MKTLTRSILRTLQRLMVDNQERRQCYSIKSCSPTTMMADSKTRYEEAVGKLNSLQTSLEEMQKIRQIEGLNKKRMVGPHVVLAMSKYMERCGITMEEFDRMPVIHVAGTKGKGSVCAFCETILRKYGLKTGLLTSPHLIEVRERIRINMKPLSYDGFSKYFFEVFNNLESTKTSFSGDMPLYNRMVAVMGFYAFLKEKVDVAVIEVGCGGEYDYTNFIRRPVVTGISSLGMDHLKTLDGTISSIAWHKAGILKPGRPAFTVPQPPEAMEVIVNRAAEIGTTVQCVPDISTYDLNNHPLQLGLAGVHQHYNASLALQLCHKFVEEKNLSQIKVISTDSPLPKRQKTTRNQIPPDLSSGADPGMVTSDPFVLPDEFITGLRDCYWPGRCQVISRDRVTYYLDGAHTYKSLKVCVDWFVKASAQEKTKGHTVRILLFNMKLSKYKPSLVKPLLDCEFAGVVCCPNNLHETDNPIVDKTCVFNTRAEQLMKSKNIKLMFESLLMNPTTSDSEKGNLNANNSSLDALKTYETSEKDGIVNSNDATHHDYSDKCVWAPCIDTALRLAGLGKDPSFSLRPSDGHAVFKSAEAADHIQILVTGSLYLVGGVLQLLDPELARK